MAGLPLVAWKWSHVVYRIFFIFAFRDIGKYAEYKSAKRTVTTENNRVDSSENKVMPSWIIQGPANVEDVFLVTDIQDIVFCAPLAKRTTIRRESLEEAFITKGIKLPFGDFTPN